MKSSSRYLHVYLLALTLSVVTVALYWQVLGHGFVNIDDQDYVFDNLHIRSGLSWKNILWSFKAIVASNWHPLTLLSHMLDCSLWGLNPTGHHLTNLIFHVLNTLLLFLILRRMTGSDYKSAFVAALFAIHPLHVESVAWVAERKDVLSTFFWMLTMLAYSFYTEHPNFKRYSLVFLFLLLGLMSKPMLVTLPFVLLLLDYWPLKRPLRLNLITEKIPLFILSIISCAITYEVQSKTGAVQLIESMSFPIRLGNAFVSYILYIGKMIWPHPLAVLYPHPRNALRTEAVFGSFALLLILSLLVLWKLRRYRYLGVGWFWYLGTLVPVIGLVQVGSQAMADRYTYIPLIGLFIMACWGIPDLLGRFRFQKAILLLSAALVFPPLMIRTWIQVDYWKDSKRLFEETLKVTRNNYMAHRSLGNALVELGKMREAIEHYEEALRINPRYAEVHNNIAAVLIKQKKFKEAVEHYLESMRIKPNRATTYNNLGVALSGLGKTEEAIKVYSEALRLDPEFLEAYKNLAANLAKLGRLEEAVKYYSEALRLDPNDAEAHDGLGGALDKLGRTEEAGKHYSKALSLNPNSVETYNNIGIQLAKQGRLEESIEYFQKALSNNPHPEEVHNNLGNVFNDLGRMDEAAVHYSEALRIKPDFAEAHNNFGVILAKQGKYEEAIKHYAEALRIKPDYEAARNNLEEASRKLKGSPS